MRYLHNYGTGVAAVIDDDDGGGGGGGGEYFCVCL